ncbi:hypothetical protein LTR05_002152 [Lithohypha guttulata]|uniref:ACB domain-containing protein n=1 Tax=Lithohypha guttulata TaxID=1690604 RepID=A0AAN7T1Y7_9EURO|nr:hypothetical protein LTR05_002152 [Lithohypha guttulata]
MEGDVEAILPRPTLPVSSPDPNNSSVHRYASRDLRTREAQAEIEKWDAWHGCRSMSRTEAKRQYISTLVDTMKEYASGTAESRELVSELEFVWNQIKNQSGSDPDNHSRSPSNNSQESPTRKLERAGMASGSLERSQSQINSMSFRSDRPSIGSTDLGGGLLSRQASGSQPPARQKQTRLKRTESGLRVLSPVSQGDSDSIIEPVDAEVEDEGNYEHHDDDDNDENEQLDTAPTSPLAGRPRARRRSTNHSQPLPGAGITSWQHTLESQLHALKTEIAALREQLSANHLLSSSSFSHTYYSMNTRQRIVHRAKLYLRTFGLLFLKQVFVQLGVLSIVLVWGRLSGDLRAERIVRTTFTRARKWVRDFFGNVLFWLFDLFSRQGRLGFIGRILRLS